MGVLVMRALEILGSIITAPDFGHFHMGTNGVSRRLYGVVDAF